MSSLGPLLVYIVRAFGMITVVCVTAFLLFSSISRGGNAWTTSACVLVIASAVLSWPRRPDAWRRDPPTDRQLEYAAALGIVTPPGISKGELSDLISQATGR